MRKICRKLVVGLATDSKGERQRFERSQEHMASRIRRWTLAVEKAVLTRVPSPESTDPLSNFYPRHPSSRSAGGVGCFRSLSSSGLGFRCSDQLTMTSNTTFRLTSTFSLSLGPFLSRCAGSVSALKATNIIPGQLWPSHLVHMPLSPPSFSVIGLK